MTATDPVSPAACAHRADGDQSVTKPFNEAVVLARVALHLDLTRRLTARDLDLPRPGDSPPG